MPTVGKSTRSFTGHHNLLPSSNRDSTLPDHVVINILPKNSFVHWTLNRGVVVWRIWPAVLFHTAFAAAVVTITRETKFNLAIPNVLITVLGVVIGFVISYRASSGYDRYWAGRTSWSEVFRNTRTITRLIWFHVPPRISPPGLTVADPKEEAKRAMREKIMALDLVEGFVIALKHHLRGELGIFYQDLYPLVKPLHDHPHHRHHPNSPLLRGYAFPEPDMTSPTTGAESRPQSLAVPPTLELPSQVAQLTPAPLRNQRDPFIPPLNSYGSFHTEPLIHSSIASEANAGHHASRKPRRTGTTDSSAHDSRSSSSNSSERAPLMPSRDAGYSGLRERIRDDLVPFGDSFKTLFRWITFRSILADADLEATNERTGTIGPERAHLVPRKRKTRPLIAGGGYNIPMEVLRSLSDWIAVLENRGTVPGTSLGTLLGCIQSYETSLAALEQVLTTPLPFVYSVHIKHTVWVYLFSLPFQLVESFGWFTIPGVSIASFIYLGFLAAGEEIEQPFGYDENDLDLDLFCRAIVHAEIEQLKRTRARNNFSSTDSKEPEARLTGGIHELAGLEHS